MPLYEYLCRKCSRRFEALVMGAGDARCPDCRSDNLEKLFSRFAVGGRGDSTPRDGSLRPDAPSPCGTCGDPRGSGSCAGD